MTGWQWLTIAWLALSGLIVVVRGVVGSTRAYTMGDAVFGFAEIAFFIWVVAVKL